MFERQKNRGAGGACCSLASKSKRPKQRVNEAYVSRNEKSPSDIVMNTTRDTQKKLHETASWCSSRKSPYNTQRPRDANATRHSQATIELRSWTTRRRPPTQATRPPSRFFAASPTTVGHSASSCARQEMQKQPRMKGAKAIQDLDPISLILPSTSSFTPLYLPRPREGCRRTGRRF